MPRMFAHPFQLLLLQVVKVVQLHQLEVDILNTIRCIHYRNELSLKLSRLITEMQETTVVPELIVVLCFCYEEHVRSSSPRTKKKNQKRKKISHHLQCHTPKPCT
ncbi:uncharacterized protein [Rutidosis leptorrhynchoides]|uniref:uncharacterized protein n=1 Tax=Rutidosis leptorrhynchoides TaxID=125765 RepID=UPI003A9936CE